MPKRFKNAWQCLKYRFKQVYDVVFFYSNMSREFPVQGKVKAFNTCQKFKLQMAQVDKVIGGP